MAAGRLGRGRVGGLRVGLRPCFRVDYGFSVGIGLIVNEDQVRPAAADDLVDPRPETQVVVAREGGGRVSALRHVHIRGENADAVVDGAAVAEDEVVAVAERQFIRPAAKDDDVVALTGFDRRFQLVLECLHGIVAVERGCLQRPGEDNAAGRGVDQNLPVIAEYRVVSIAVFRRFHRGDHHLVGLPRTDDVGGELRDAEGHEIRPAAANDDVVALAQADLVVARKLVRDAFDKAGLEIGVAAVEDEDPAPADRVEVAGRTIGAAARDHHVISAAPAKRVVAVGRGAHGFNTVHQRDHVSGKVVKRRLLFRGRVFRVSRLRNVAQRLPDRCVEVDGPVVADDEIGERRARNAVVPATADQEVWRAGCAGVVKVQDRDAVVAVLVGARGLDEAFRKVHRSVAADQDVAAVAGADLLLPFAADDRVVTGAGGGEDVVVEIRAEIRADPRDAFDDLAVAKDAAGDRGEVADQDVAAAVVADDVAVEELPGRPFAADDDVHTRPAGQRVGAVERAERIDGDDRFHHARTGEGDLGVVADQDVAARRVGQDVRAKAAEKDVVAAEAFDHVGAVVELPPDQHFAPERARIDVAEVELGA